MVMEYVSAYWVYIVAAFITLAVLIIFLLVYRALNTRVRGRRGARLGISEYHELDKDRRLVLVRRDGVEHLLLIGGAQDIVVENNITGGDDMIEDSFLNRQGPSEVAHSQADTHDNHDHAPIPLRPAPRPAVFGNRRPVLRPVERSDPRLTQGRDFGPDEQA
jgi:hypothetical protein